MLCPTVLSSPEPYVPTTLPSSSRPARQPLRPVSQSHPATPTVNTAALLAWVNDARTVLQPEASGPQSAAVTRTPVNIDRLLADPCVGMRPVCPLYNLPWSCGASVPCYHEATVGGQYVVVWEYRSVWSVKRTAWSISSTPSCPVACANVLQW